MGVTLLSLDNILKDKRLDKNVKVSYSVAEKLIDLHNFKCNVRKQFEDDNFLKLYIVFKMSNWDYPYTEKERTYVCRSDNKRFVAGMLGSSLYGDCLDGNDLGVRLDWTDWKIDYCYFDVDLTSQNCFSE